MGTLCKNCPFKDVKRVDEGHCTTLFIKKYHNSCVTYDINENDEFSELFDFLSQFNEKPKNISEKKKTSSKKSSTKKNKKETKAKNNEQISTESNDENTVNN